MEVFTDINFIEKNKFQVNTSSGTEIYCDIKKDNHQPSGPNSLELFLSSLGCCIGVYAKLCLIKHKIDFTQLKIRAKGELSSKPPLRLVNLGVEIKTDAQLKDKKDLFLRYVHNCPIHNTLMRSSNIEIKLL